MSPEPSFYASIKLRDYIAKKRFGEPEIADQKITAARVEKKADELRGDKRGIYFQRAFGFTFAITVVIFGMLGAAIGDSVGHFSTGWQVGIIVAFLIAYIVADKLTTKKFGKDTKKFERE